MHYFVKALQEHQELAGAFSVIRSHDGVNEVR
jgi:hypothetical protein